MKIVETGPRDGLQNEPTILSTSDKAAFIRKLIASGLRRIEVTSFVNPKAVPALADADDLMRMLPRSPDVAYSALVVNQRGLERALAAAIDEVNIVVPVTDSLAEANQGMSAAQALRQLRDLTAAARAHGIWVTGTLAAAFGCPFEGRQDIDKVRRCAMVMVECGIDELCLADTIGVGTPYMTSQLAAMLAELSGEHDVAGRLHFHNTRNTGYANVVAARHQGIDCFDATTGGIGGCPFSPGATGNIATEDLVYLLGKQSVGGIDLRRLVEVVTWLDERLDSRCPGLVARSSLFGDWSAPTTGTT